MKKITQLLKKIGLLDSEVDTYLALLELGPSTVLEIARKISFSRQSIYTALEGLKAKNLVGILDDEKRVKYVAESPNVLLSYAERRLTEMQTIVKEVKDRAKELKLLQKGEKPVVRMFESDETQSVFDLFASKSKEIYDFSNIDVLRKNKKVLEKTVIQFKKKPNPKHVKSLIIGQVNNENTVSDSFEETKVVTDPEIDFTGSISINDNQILLETFEKKYLSILIDSKVLAKTMKSLFQLAWKNTSNKKIPR